MNTTAVKPASVTQEGNMGDHDEDLTNVPANVLKQQREADRKMKEATAAPVTTPDEGTPTPVPDATPVIEPVPVIEPIAAPVAPIINDGTQPDGQFEHKYNVLKGKYDKEVGDLRGLVTDLKTQMERQEIVIQGLNSQHSEQAPIKPVDMADLNPEDFQGWGDEMKTMVSTVNRLKAVVQDQNTIIAGYTGQPAPAATTDESELQGRVESLESEVNDGRITSYIKYLDDNIKGDWRALNKDARFNAWLAVNDPISMAPRKGALTSAAENLRGSQVASIFNLYIADNGNTAGVTIADELPLSSGDGGGDLTPTVTLTQADIAKAQQDFVQGRMTEENFDKLYSQYQSTLRRQKTG
jgi:hypothetical protein